MLGYGFDITLIFVIPAMIFAMIAQFKVRSVFSRYSKTPCKSGLTGAQTARRLLFEAGVSDVEIERISGNLNDHYDPRQRVLRLSAEVHDSTSVAALGVAAHETGHAIQHSLGYSPLALRNSILPVASLGSKIAMPLFILGMFITYLAEIGGGFGFMLMQAGIVLFTLVVIFQLVTLPVEFNASRQALYLLENGNILDSDETARAKQVLNAAAMTYVASAAVGITQLLRLLLISGRRR